MTFSIYPGITVWLSSERAAGQRPADEWNPDDPDENRSYYRKRLEELTAGEESIE